MSLREIRIYDDPLLRQVSKEVKEITAEHRKLATDMTETMYDASGIGLAAVQVGVPQRLIVVDAEWARGEEDDRPPKRPLTMINPEIVEESDEDEAYKEGCLSLPEIEGEVWRSIKIKVKYRGLDGREAIQDCEDLFARCILHEIDHLDGILFIDRMSEENRKKLNGPLRRLASREQTPPEAPGPEP